MNSRRSLIILSAAAILAIAGDTCAQVTFYSIGKSGYYVQSADAAPVPDAGDNHFFDTFVEPAADVVVDLAILRTPSGAQLDLLPFLFYFDNFTSQAALDAAFGNGTYSFTVTTSDLDVFTGQLTMAGPYPNVPRLVNFTAAQSINPASPFTLEWGSFGNATANDTIQVYVEADDDGTVVFQSADPGDPNALNGTNTTVTIPAGRFTAGKSYKCYLTFTRLVEMTGVGGALGLSTLTRETLVPLKAGTGGGTVTVNIAGFSLMPNGAFQLAVGGTAGATFRLEATSNFSSWSTLVTTNPPSGIFTYVDTPPAGTVQRFYRVRAN